MRLNRPQRRRSVYQFPVPLATLCEYPGPLRRPVRSGIIEFGSLCARRLCRIFTET